MMGFEVGLLLGMMGIDDGFAYSIWRMRHVS